MSRNALSLDARFPEIAAALADDPAAPFVVDGEIVAFDGTRTSFARLQQRGERPVATFLYLFDLLHLAGRDTTRAAPAGAQAPAGPRAHVLRPDPLHPPPQPRRRGALSPGLRGGLGGADRQARGRALHARPLARLAEVQVRGRAGAGDRRLHGAARQPPGAGRAAAGPLRRRAPALRGQGGHRVHPGDAARPRRSTRGRCAGRSRPSPTRRACATRPGWSRGWSREIGFTEWTRDGRLRHPRFLGPPRRQGRPGRWCASERRRHGRAPDDSRSATPTACCGRTPGSPSSTSPATTPTWPR